MKRKIYVLSIALLAGLMACTTIVAQVSYVKAGGTGTGTSWADASGNLQAIINASAANSQIWVSAGTYYPTTTTDRYISFIMKNGVAILGGFPNTGNPALTDRNWEANVTILSADIGVTGNNSDNSNHVIFNDGNGLNLTDILDGFNVVTNPTLSSTGSVTYYAQSSDGTCNSLTRTAVTLTINAAPAAPTSGGNQVQCQQSPIETLTATATGGAITWYDAATNGNVVANPTLSSTGSVTYYAQASDGTCNSLTRTAVILTINPAPAPPTSGGDQVQCQQSPIQTLTATATGGPLHGIMLQLMVI
jgi:hypothetical protein